MSRIIDSLAGVYLNCSAFQTRSASFYHFNFVMKYGDSIEALPSCEKLIDGRASVFALIESRAGLGSCAISCLNFVMNSSPAAFCERSRGISSENLLSS